MHKIKQILDLILFSAIIGLSLLVIILGVAHGETIDEVNLIEGSLINGTLSNTYVSDDTYYSFNEVTGTPGFLLDMNITNYPITSNTIIQIDLEYHYNGSMGHNVDLELFDGAEYIIIYNLTETVGDNVIREIRNIPESYFQNDELWFRFNHTSPGSMLHEFGIDYFNVGYDISLNGNFNLIYNTTITYLWTNSYIFDCSNYSITIQERCLVNGSGLFHGRTLNLSIGSLYCRSGGIFNSTSGKLSIVKKFTSNNLIYFFSGSTFLHNKGNISVKGDIGTDYIWWYNPGNFYDFYYYSYSLTEWIGSSDIRCDNNFTLNVGSPSWKLYSTGKNFYCDNMNLKKGILNNFQDSLYVISNDLVISNSASIWHNVLGTGISKLSVGGEVKNRGSIDIKSNSIWDVGNMSNSNIFYTPSNKINIDYDFTNNGTIQGDIELNFQNNPNYLKINDLNLSISNLNTSNLNDNTFISEGTNIIIKGINYFSNSITIYNFLNLSINGTIYFIRNSILNETNTYLYTSKLLYSTGELNISANVNYPFRLYGYSNNTLIDLGNMTDYYLINVEVKNFTNINSEYITIHGSDKGNLYGLWDFTPPLILYLNLSEGSILAKGGDNLFNFSFYCEELSYIHSYNWTITHKLTDTLFAYGQYNFSSATNHTTKVQFYNITFWYVGEYWYNITCYDTHNKLSETAINKEKIKDVKIEGGGKSVGKYDIHKDKLMGKTLRMYNYLSNNTIYGLEWMNTENEKNTIIWRDSQDNYKMDYEVTLQSANYAKLKIFANKVRYIPEANNFIINEIYFYDISDFLLADSNNYVRVSNLMKTKNYDYYTIEFHNDQWETKDTVRIDPLSGMTNNGNATINITVSGQLPVYGNGNLENSTSYYEDYGNTYEIIISYQLSNTTKYILTSSVDGEFYNSSSNTTFNTNLSVGSHSIQFKVMDELYGFTILDNITVYVIAKPISLISNINPMGQIVTFTGTYASIENNTISKYVWRSNLYPTGPFYNGTVNPIEAHNFALGNHTIYFRVRDIYGRYSEETNTTVFVLNVTIEEVGEDEAEIWYNSPTDFLNVYGFIMVITFATIIIYMGIRRYLI